MSWFQTMYLVGALFVGLGLRDEGATPDKAAVVAVLWPLFVLSESSGWLTEEAYLALGISARPTPPVQPRENTG